MHEFLDHVVGQALVLAPLHNGIVCKGALAEFPECGDRPHLLFSQFEIH